MPGSHTRVDSGSGGRHRRAEPYRGRHLKTRAVRTASAARRALVLLLLVSTGTGSLLFTSDRVATAPTTLATVDAVTPAPSERSPEAASRSGHRPTPQSTTSTQAPAASKPSATAPSTRLAMPRGLTQKQANHAAVIVRVGQQLQMPKRAYVIAIATALQESYLRNLANPAVPSSLNYSYDGLGSDHDSVGLFQQRPSTGWGTVAELMDPATAARRFYEALAEVSGWQNLSLTAAAQAVQKSAFPYAYAKHESLATLVVDSLLAISG